jgi:hypothetical protein
MKICSECKHFCEPSSCLRKRVQYATDVIDGYPRYTGYLDCRSERKRRFIFKTNCGPEGIFWEPKNDYEHLNKYWPKSK